MRVRLPAAFEGPLTPGAIQQQIEAWQPVMGLADWDVRYSPEPPDSDERARIDSWRKRRIAAVRLAADIPVEAVDRAIVHELLHLWFNQLGDLYPRAFTPPHIDDVHDAAWDLVEHQIIHALEGAITGRALVLWDEPAWTKPWQTGATLPPRAASAGPFTRDGHG